MNRKFVSLLTLVVLFLTTITFAACTDKEEDLTVTDCVFSSFTAEDYDGNIIDETIFAEYKVTMLNVWGTFCSPCKTEAPELAEINSEYADKGFQVIGIPVDANRNSAADAMEVIAETNANFRHLKVSNSIKQFVAQTEHLPYTIFVNSEGKQIGEAYSGAKSKEDWKKIVDKLLEFK